MDTLVLKRTRLDSPEAQVLLAEWNDELIATVPGFPPSGGSTVHNSEFIPPHGVVLVAIAGDLAVGCGGIRRLDRSTAEIKRLFVKPEFRGRGIGRALLSRFEKHARNIGYETVRLDTTGREPGALALFQRSGYLKIPDYNGNPHARHWFEKHLGAF